MKFFYYVIISIISGVVAGMGMGGGTLLIPALTLIMDVPQNIAQGINLLVFVPCAIVVCIIYTKSKLINYKKSWLICLSAVAISVLFNFARNCSSNSYNCSDGKRKER